MNAKSPRQRARLDRKQIPLAFDETKISVALPLEAQLQATRLFGQLLLAVSRKQTTAPSHEYRKDHFVA